MKPTVQQHLPPMPLERVHGGVRNVANCLRDWQALPDKARARCGLSQKQMAGEMGISSAQLSDQLSGREGAHLSLWRLFALGRDFWAELVLLIIEFYDLPIGNLSEIDKRDLEYGRALRVTRKEGIAHLGCVVEDTGTRRDGGA